MRMGKGIRALCWSIVVLFVAVSSMARAQSNNAIGVTIEFAPEAEVSGDERLPTTLPEVAYRNVRANAIAPIKIDSWNAVLLPGFAYRLYRPRQDESVGEEFEDPGSLHDLSLNLGILKRLNTPGPSLPPYLSAWPLISRTSTQNTCAIKL
ncbi:MAG: hypothetical protein AAF605_09085 [Myxococcota bacterium]